jgi:hypothetical protein
MSFTLDVFGLLSTWALHHLWVGVPGRSWHNIMDGMSVG